MVLALNLGRAARNEAESGRAEAVGLHLPQIPALTGLRFFAAAFILMEHAADWLAQFSDSNVRQYFMVLGMYGMPLFFVLSGFVIHYNYRKLFLSRSIARATCEFAAARFARLFPLYFCLLLVAICADNLLGEVQGDLTLFARILAYYITLTQSWWYIVIDNRLIINWLFALSWSISTEMYFYVAYVAVVFVILLVRRGRTAVAAAIAYGIVVMCLFVLSRHYLGSILFRAEHFVPNYIPPDDFQNSFYRWLFYFSPYVRVFEFLMGCLTAHAFILTHDRPLGSAEQQYANVILVVVLLYLTLCGLLYLNVLRIVPLNDYIGHLYLNFLCAPAIAFVMFHVARYDSWLSRMLSLPSLILLGDSSYSIYLLHAWTLRLFNRQAPPLDLAWGLDTLLRVVCGIGLTLVTAYATYRLIEAPSRAWLRRKLGAVIGNAFGDRSRRPDQASVVLVPAGEAAKRPSSAGLKLAFSMSALMLLGAVAVAGQVAQSDAAWRKLHRLWAGDRPDIEIISATYGMSCKDFAEPPPFRNLVVQGNATQAMRRTCEGRQQCSAVVNLSMTAGDPAANCGKDFSVKYTCYGSDSVHLAYVPGEALGRALTLDCGAPSPPPHKER